MLFELGLGFQVKPDSWTEFVAMIVELGDNEIIYLN